MSGMSYWSYGALLVVAVILGGLTLWLAAHRFRLRQEARLHPAPGELVSVEGTPQHVFTAGRGQHTLVFLAGHGTCCPTLDFKPLWSELQDHHRIVVVERPGYGWSQPSKRPRSVEQLLSETREALRRSGEQPPFVLVPHSMAGLESLLWAQRFPKEVSAIIGLDACVPRSIELLPKPKWLGLYLMGVMVRCGLPRLMNDTDLGRALPLLGMDELTDQEKAALCVRFYRGAVSSSMLQELHTLTSNAKQVGVGSPPVHTPVLSFVSETQTTDVKGWDQRLSEYFSQMTINQQIMLDGGHYLHYTHSKEMCRTIESFLLGITEKHLQSY